MKSIHPPFFSIIVTVYNKSEHLARCLTSLVHQDSNYEVIILDDCSSDGSVAIGRQFSEKYTHFRMIELTANHNVSYVRNLGAKEALGEYLIFADADDWYSMMSLGALKKILEKNNHPQVGIFAYKKYKDFDYENTITFTNHLKSKRRVINTHEVMSLYVNSKLCASPWNKVFNKSFWINGGFEWPTLDQLYTPHQGSEDFAILPYAICKSDRTIISDYDFYNYNVNDSSKSATCSMEEIKACLYSGYSLTDKFINDEVFLKMNNFNVHGLVFSHFRYIFNLNKQSMSEAYMQLFLDTINDYIQKYSVKIKKNNLKAIERFYTDYTAASHENNYFLGDINIDISLYKKDYKKKSEVKNLWKFLKSLRSLIKK